METGRERMDNNHRNKLSTLIKNRQSLVFFTLLSLLFLVGCDKDRVYDHFYDLPSGGWDMDSIYRFDTEIGDTLTPHNILINLRHGGEYQYRNLILFVNIRFPNEKILTDTVNCILADERGKWHSKGWGSLWTNTVMYKRRIRFPISGHYSISVQHAMRDKELKAISNIGIRIEKSK